MGRPRRRPGAAPWVGLAASGQRRAAELVPGPAGVMPRCRQLPAMTCKRLHCPCLPICLFICLRIGGKGALAPGLWGLGRGAALCAAACARARARRRQGGSCLPPRRHIRAWGMCFPAPWGQPDAPIARAGRPLCRSGRTDWRLRCVAGRSSGSDRGQASACQARRSPDRPPCLAAAQFVAIGGGPVCCGLGWLGLRALPAGACLPMQPGPCSVLPPR